MQQLLFFPPVKNLERILTLNPTKKKQVHLIAKKNISVLLEVIHNNKKKINPDIFQIFFF